MKISGIYKIQSKVHPNRIYIGSAVNINKRWNEHLHELRKGQHPNKKIRDHVSKYGIIDLSFSILLGCPKEDLLKIEQYFLDSYNPWFNIQKQTERTNLGLKASDETKQKLRISHLGYIWSEESRKKLSETNKGRKNSPEAIEKIRIANTGKTHSEETKKKISEQKKGNKYNLGRKCSEEKRQKLRLVNLGKKQSEETIMKRSKSLRLAWVKRKLKKAI